MKKIRNEADMYDYSWMTPLGLMRVRGTHENIYTLSFSEERGQSLDAPSALFKELQRQVEAYFKKKHRKFDIPFVWQGTAFQQQVWQNVLHIGCGETSSYQEQACSIGRPKAWRAVGGALGKNALALLVPCHRVVSVHSQGYRWGIERKMALLRHEGHGW